MLPDHLGEVGKFGRALGIVCLTVSTLLFGAAFLGLVAMLILDMPADAEKVRSLIISTIFAGAFAGVSLWMLVRLLTRTRARNGVTLMPIWFIELFGILLLGGVVAWAITLRSPLLFVESLSVTGAMLFVRRKVRARLRQMEESELSDFPSVEADN